MENSCSFEKLKTLPLIKSKVQLVSNGYPQHTYSITPYNNGNRLPKILCICRVSREKGVDLLLEAFHATRSAFPDWHIQFIGPIWDEVYYNELKDYIQLNNLKDRVIFYGFQDEGFITKELQESSIFCLASRFESFGNVRLEAMVNGLPLITTKAGCGDDFDKFGSIVVPINDKKALVQKMKTLMDSAELRNSIAKTQQFKLESYIEKVKLLAE